MTVEKLDLTDHLPALEKGSPKLTEGFAFEFLE
jgi:hypothetical protein